MIYYSPSRKGFFDSVIHTSIPQDAVELTDEAYQALLNGQTAGKIIVPGEDGAPTLEDRVETPSEPAQTPSTEEPAPTPAEEPQPAPEPASDEEHGE